MNLLKMFKRKPRQSTIYVKYFPPYTINQELEYTGDWVDVRVNDTPQVLQPNGKFKEVSSLLDERGQVAFPIKADSLIKIPLGFGLIMPDHYEAIVKPRSSLSKNTGLIWATSGVIDEGYCGDNDQWFIVLYATRDCELMLSERVAQFRIQEKQPKLKFKTVNKLKDKDRGGHGSTGRL